MARRLSLPAISILIPAKDLYLVDTKTSLRSCSFTSGAYSLSERICKVSLEERHFAASLFLEFSKLTSEISLGVHPSLIKSVFKTLGILALFNALLNVFSGFPFR